MYIEPGSPWENGYAESFHSRVRVEFLALEVFDNLSTARRLTNAWRSEYNDCRPHSSLGYLTPSKLATQRTASTSVAALPPFQQPPAKENLLPVTYDAHNRPRGTNRKAKVRCAGDFVALVKSSFGEAQRTAAKKLTSGDSPIGICELPVIETPTEFSAQAELSLRADVFGRCDRST